ncbi:MAG: 30S ribosomal protein S7 [Planctomycetes bacterium]|nr:30S ribosomal protein S7 [Planctomycetota bacterium]MCK5578700.1 30S ribosomal protein S7 [Planctomycetota bacterium]
MAKKFKSFEHLLEVDPRYNSKLIGKFINNLMLKGKKSTAQQIFYQALEVAGKKISDVDPLDIFNTALGNVKPIIEVRSKRIGGATYQVPIQVTTKRQTSLAIRWILKAVRGKKGRPAYQKLADELVAAYKKEGAAMTNRQNVHKMAEANKAFAHFA